MLPRTPSMERRLRVTGAAAFAPLLIVGFASLLFLPAILIMGGYGWDDGAITVSYSQTIAEAGRFSLTPPSPISEGTSSLLYALLMVPFFLIGPVEFADAVFISQCISFAMTVATALYLHRILGRYVPSELARLSIALLYILVPMNLAETLNGMEMTTFGLLLLLHSETLRRQGPQSYLISALLLLTRFEAVFYLAVAAAGTFLFDRDIDARRRIGKQLTFVLVSFAVITAWRLYMFGQVFPNTVVAKMSEPYSASGTAGLQMKIAGGLMFLRVFGIMIASIFVLSVAAGSTRILRSHGFWLAVSFFLFSLISGGNSGYEGRMFLGLLPVLVVLLASTAALAPAMGKGGLAGLAVAGVMLLMVPSSLFLENLRSIKIASNYSEQKRDDVSESGPYEYGWYGATPENYRITGQAVQRIAEIAGLEVIDFAAPDVGGLGLCCETIAVHDTALLTNPILAREGYGFFHEHLAQVRPHVIETHSMWSMFSRIYESPYFSENYEPVIFQNNFLWLRDDVYEAVIASETGRHSLVDPLGEAPIRYLSDEFDRQYLRDAGIGQVARVDI